LIFCGFPRASSSSCAVVSDWARAVFIGKQFYSGVPSISLFLTSRALNPERMRRAVPQKAQMIQYIVVLHNR
jgi:hypothetical protein